MKVEPAHVNQVQRGVTGRMLEVDADVGGVAEDLKRIDPSLRVRFAEAGNPPFFAVYHESEDGRSTYLVLTVKAYQTSTGVWAGLDQRVVKRIMEIGHSSYDFAAEVERANVSAKSRTRKEFREKVEASAEEAAFALRKDLGVRYRGRAFIPKSL